MICPPPLLEKTESILVVSWLSFFRVMSILMLASSKATRLKPLGVDGDVGYADPKPKSPIGSDEGYMVCCCMKSFPPAGAPPPKMENFPKAQ